MDNFLAHLYECTGSPDAHPLVSVGAGIGVSGGNFSISKIFKFYIKLLCDGQGAVKEAILYMNRFCLTVGWIKTAKGERCTPSLYATTSI